MAENDRLKFYFATALLVFLVVFLIWAMRPFLNAFFGAFVVFFLFKGFYRLLTVKKGWSKSLSAATIMVVATLVVVIPLFFGSSLLISEVTSAVSNPQPFIEGVDAFTSSSFFEKIPLNIDDVIEELLTRASSMFTNLVVNLIGNVTNVFLNLVLFYFVLYFLITGSKTFEKTVRPYIPFNKRNADKLVRKFRDVTYATLVSAGLIALFQGIFIGLGFLVFGIPGAAFWGFMALVISFLPVVGVPLIWVPASLIQIFMNGRIGAGIGILIWGGILSLSDNFLRPIIQHKVGKLHPLVTLIGVFIGLPLFGILGLFIGPLLISYALLIIKMYSEEYGTF